MLIDDTDRAILSILSRDARRPFARVAEQVGLTQSTCSRRIQFLEQSGLIMGYAAQLTYSRLGYAVTALVHITLSAYAEADVADFEHAACSIEGVVECISVSGAHHYQLKIICRDLTQYSRILREDLGYLPGISNIQSNFVLRRVFSPREADMLFDPAPG